MKKCIQAILLTGMALFLGGCVADVQSNFHNSIADRDYVNRDFQNAFSHYKDAAEKGNAYAYYNLYVMYNYGQGVRRDVQMSTVMLKKAVDLGDPTAQVVMANRLLSGKDKNVQEALVLLKLAAQKENVYAYSDLSLLYRYGYGVKQDTALADEYQRLAEANGSKLSLVPKRAYTKSTSNAPSKKELVLGIQEGLKKLGFYTGKVDGSSGPMSLKAIQMFQKSYGYPINTTISETLLQEIKSKLN